MIGWHHRLNGHGFEETLGDSDGQGILACCNPWGHSEMDTTEQLNNKQQLYAISPKIEMPTYVSNKICRDYYAEK